MAIKLVGEGLLFYEECPAQYKQKLAAGHPLGPGGPVYHESRNLVIFYPTLEDLFRGHLYRARVGLGPREFEYSIYAANSKGELKLVDLTSPDVAIASGYVRVADTVVSDDAAAQMILDNQAHGLAIRGNGLASTWTQIELIDSAARMFTADHPNQPPLEISTDSPAMLLIERQLLTT